MLAGQETKMAQQEPGTQQAHMSALQGNLIYVNMSSACACMCVSSCYLGVQTLQEELMYRVWGGGRGGLKSSQRINA